MFFRCLPIRFDIDADAYYHDYFERAADYAACRRRHAFASRRCRSRLCLPPLLIITLTR